MSAKPGKPFGELATAAGLELIFAASVGLVLGGDGLVGLSLILTGVVALLIAFACAAVEAERETRRS